MNAYNSIPNQPPTYRVLRSCLDFITPLLLLAVVGLCIGGCNQAKEPAKPNMAYADPPIETKAVAPTASPQEGSWVAVARGTLRQLYPATGNFRARQITNIGPQIGGRIQTVLVDVGDSVKKGQELVRIDPKFIEIELAQRKAEIENAKVGISNTELNFNRMKTLWDVPKGQTPSVSQKYYDDAKSQFDSARAQLKMAEVALSLAEEHWRETVIRAPYDGVISKRFVHPGEQVTAAPVSRLLEIQETGILELEFSLPQNMLSQVKTGTPVEFEVDGIQDSLDTGKISVVYPDLDEATRSFRCRVILNNVKQKYRPGLLAQVRVVVQEIPDALYVPLASLSQTANSYQVQVYDEGRPSPCPVEVGLMTADKVEIRKGLQEKAKVFMPKIVR